MADLKSGRIRILVCTDACGMGVHCAIILRVVQWKLTERLKVDNLYQRIGRAGRDMVTPALGLIFVSTVHLLPKIKDRSSNEVDLIVTDERDLSSKEVEESDGNSEVGDEDSEVGDGDSEVGDGDSEVGDGDSEVEDEAIDCVNKGGEGKEMIVEESSENKNKKKKKKTLEMNPELSLAVTLDTKDRCETFLKSLWADSTKNSKSTPESEFKFPNLDQGVLWIVNAQGCRQCTILS